MATTGNVELDGFVAKYTHEVAALTNAILDRLRALSWAPRSLPTTLNRARHWLGAYDQTSPGVLSQAVYPRWVNLCLLRGIDVPDPHGLLAGSGIQVRTIRLTTGTIARRSADRRP